MADADGVRLQKVLSQAGVASRRVAERMIVDGRVEVDGHITELGTRVDPGASVIRVDGTRITVDDSMVYLALNKPVGMHSTMSDDLGRPASETRWRSGFRQQEPLSRGPVGCGNRRVAAVDQ